MIGCCKEDSSNQRDISVQEIASTNQEPLIKPQGKKKLGLMRKMTVKKKIIAWTTVALLLLAAAFFYFKFYYVFGEGVKAGELNFVVYKGYVWKTYEGRAIQAGFQKGSRGATTAIQSYEFDFSVEDEAIADTLMRCSGRNVQLHYREYLGALPWRGQQKYIVDRILSVE